MKKDLEVKILIGVPASGKSTWAKNFLLKNPNYVRINRDSFRLMLRNEQMCENKIESMITTLFMNSVKTALAANLNVIIDNTNVKIKYINTFIDELKYYANITYQVFDISLEKAIERDKNRPDSVGEDVIKRMYEDYKILIDSFDFNPVKQVKEIPRIVPNFNSNLEDCVIFDVDGTLALIGDRSPYDQKRAYVDDPNIIVAEQVQFHKDKGRKIIIMSGRDGDSRKVTEEWLDFYNIQYDELYMRSDNDIRKDKIVKKELYENHIKGKYNVLAWYDDRLQVIDLIYDLGIFCFNVNQGGLIF